MRGDKRGQGKKETSWRVGGGQEMGRDGGRTEVCRSSRWRDTSKTSVPRDEEEGADVGSGFKLGGGGSCAAESCGVMMKKVWQ